MRLEGPDALLAILIKNQDKWVPQICLSTKNARAVSPMTLIGVLVK